MDTQDILLSIGFDLSKLNVQSASAIKDMRAELEKAYKNKQIEIPVGITAKKYLNNLSKQIISEYTKINEKLNSLEEQHSKDIKKLQDKDIKDRLAAQEKANKELIDSNNKVKLSAIKDSEETMDKIVKNMKEEEEISEMLAKQKIINAKKVADNEVDMSNKTLATKKINAEAELQLAISYAKSKQRVTDSVMSSIVPSSGTSTIVGTNSNAELIKMNKQYAEIEKKDYAERLDRVNSYLATRNARVKSYEEAKNKEIKRLEVISSNQTKANLKEVYDNQIASLKSTTYNTKKALDTDIHNKKIATNKEIAILKASNNESALLIRGNVAAKKKANDDIVKDAKVTANELSKAEANTFSGSFTSGSSFGHKIGTTLQYATAGSAIYTVSAALKEAVAMSVKYDNALFNTIAVLKASRYEANQLLQSNRDLSIEYGLLVDDVDKASITLGRAGVSVSELAEATKVTAQLSMITGDTMDNSSKVVSSFTMAFGLASAQVQELGNQLAYAANASKLSIDDLGTVASYALSGAKALGLTKEEVLALSTAFSNVGVSASTIGTQIRKFSEIVRDVSATSTKFFEVLGVDQEKLRKDLKGNNEEALMDFIKNVANMNDEAYNTAVNGMDTLEREFLDRLRITSGMIDEHYDNIIAGGDNLEAQSRVQAMSIAAMWNSAIASMAKSVSGWMTLVADSFTVRNEVGTLLEIQKKLKKGSEEEIQVSAKINELLNIKIDKTKEANDAEMSAALKGDKVAEENAKKRINETIAKIKKEKELLEVQATALTKTALNRTAEGTGRSKDSIDSANKYDLARAQGLFDKANELGKQIVTNAAELEKFNTTIVKTGNETQRMLSFTEKGMRNIEKESKILARGYLTAKENRDFEFASIQEREKAALSEVDVVKQRNELEAVAVDYIKLESTYQKDLADEAKALAAEKKKAASDEKREDTEQERARKSALSLEKQKLETQLAADNVGTSKLIQLDNELAMQQTLYKYAEDNNATEQDKLKISESISKINQSIFETKNRITNGLNKQDAKEEKAAEKLRKEALATEKQRLETQLAYDNQTADKETKLQNELTMQSNLLIYAAQHNATEKETLAIIEDIVKANSAINQEGLDFGFGLADSLKDTTNELAVQNMARENSVSLESAKLLLLNKQLFAEGKISDKQLESNKKTIEDIATIREELEGLTDIEIKIEGLDKLSSLVDNIYSTFDNIPDSLKKNEPYLEGMEKTSSSILDYGKSQLEIEQEKNESVKNGMSEEDASAKAKAKNQQNEITMYGNIAGAIAGMAEEGSDAQKVLLIAQQGIAVANAVSSIAAAGVNGDAYTAPARVAAMIGIMAGVLSMAGIAFSGNVKTSTSSDAFSAQEANTGTGSTLGDAEKMSESISNSMDILEDFAEPQYQTLQSMNKYLANISNNIGGLTSLLIQSGGFKFGEGFTDTNSGYKNVIGSNTQQYGGLALGAVSGALMPQLAVGSAMSLFGGSAVAGGVSSLLSAGFSTAAIGAMASTGVGLAVAALDKFLLDGAISNLVGSVLGGIFGKTSVSQALTDSGIYFADTLLSSAINEFNGQAYQTIETTTSKKSWFSKSSSTSVSSYFQDLDSETERQFSLVLDGLYQTTLLAGDALDANSASLTNSLNNFVVSIGKISLNGKTGDEIQESISAIFGRVGDDIAKASFPLLASFQAVGEGMFTTMTRVATGMEEAEYYIERLGQAFNDISYTAIINKSGDVGFEALLQSIVKVDEATYGLNNNLVLILDTLDSTAEELYGTYVILDNLRYTLGLLNLSTEALSFASIRGAGSVSELESGINSYIDNFLSDSEQLTYNTNMLQKEFNKLNIATPISKEAFTDLIESMDLTSESGQELYGRVIVLSESFAEVANEVSDAIQTLQDELEELTDNGFSTFTSMFDALFASILSMAVSTQNTINSIISSSEEDDQYAQLVRYNKLNEEFKASANTNDYEKTSSLYSELLSLSSTLSVYDDSNQFILNDLYDNLDLFNSQEEVIRVNVVDGLGVLEGLTSAQVEQLQEAVKDGKLSNNELTSIVGLTEEQKEGINTFATNSNYLSTEGTLQDLATYSRLQLDEYTKSIAEETAGLSKQTLTYGDYIGKQEQIDISKLLGISYDDSKDITGRVQDLSISTDLMKDIGLLTGFNGESFDDSTTKSQLSALAQYTDVDIEGTISQLELQGKEAKDARIIREAEAAQKAEFFARFDPIVAWYNQELAERNAAYNYFKSVEWGIYSHPIDDQIMGAEGLYAYQREEAQFQTANNAYQSILQEKNLLGYAYGTPYMEDDQIAGYKKGEIVIPTTFSDGLRKGELSLSNNKDNLSKPNFNEFASVANNRDIFGINNLMLKLDKQNDIIQKQSMLIKESNTYLKDSRDLINSGNMTMRTIEGRV